MHGNNKFFSLREGEKVLYEAKPERGYMWYRSLQIFVTLFVVSLFVLFRGSEIIRKAMNVSIFESILITIPVFIFVSFALSILVGILMYKKRYYWMTNSRILLKSGIVGYSIKSIPLERISDVRVSRSFVESIFGISSLRLQTLAGQRGEEGKISGIKNPDNLQDYLFKLIKYKRRKEHLTI